MRRRPHVPVGPRGPPRPLDTAELDLFLASDVDETVPVSTWMPEIVHGAIGIADELTSTYIIHHAVWYPTPSAAAEG